MPDKRSSLTAHRGVPVGGNQALRALGRREPEREVPARCEGGNETQKRTTMRL